MQLRKKIEKISAEITDLEILNSLKKKEVMDFSSRIINLKRSLEYMEQELKKESKCYACERFCSNKWCPYAER